MFVLAVLSVLCQLPGTCDVAPREMPAVAPEEEKGSGVKLHRPDGTEIFVNPRAIAFVQNPADRRDWQCHHRVLQRGKAIDARERP